MTTDNNSVLPMKKLETVEGTKISKITSMTASYKTAVYSRLYNDIKSTASVSKWMKKSAKLTL